MVMHLADRQTKVLGLVLADDGVDLVDHQHRLRLKFAGLEGFAGHALVHHRLPCQSF
jgi:hypothetical protein